MRFGAASNRTSMLCDSSNRYPPSFKLVLWLATFSLFQVFQRSCCRHCVVL